MRGRFDYEYLHLRELALVLGGPDKKIGRSSRAPCGKRRAADIDDEVGRRGLSGGVIACVAWSEAEVVEEVFVVCGCDRELCGL